MAAELFINKHHLEPSYEIEISYYANLAKWSHRNTAAAYHFFSVTSFQSPKTQLILKKYHDNFIQFSDKNWFMYTVHGLPYSVLKFKYIDVCGGFSLTF